MESNYINIFALIDMLQGFSRLIDWMVAGNEREACNEKLERYKVDILFLTRGLNKGLKLPLTRSEARIKEFCFESASLFFLHRVRIGEDVRSENGFASHRRGSSAEGMRVPDPVAALWAQACCSYWGRVPTASNCQKQGTFFFRGAMWSCGLHIFFF
jgi:hypothetical protein